MLLVPMRFEKHFWEVTIEILSNVPDFTCSMPASAGTPAYCYLPGVLQYRFRVEHGSQQTRAANTFWGYMHRHCCVWLEGGFWDFVTGLVWGGTPLLTFSLSVWVMHTDDTKGLELSTSV